MMTKTNRTTMDQDFSLLKGSELISLRAISQKTFDLGKGRRQAISYSEPVHFFSADKLIDIDNRLVPDEKNNILRTTANAYTTELAIKDNGKAIITLRRDGAAFPLSYLGESTGSDAEILEPEKAEHATEQEARADLSATLHSGVKYTELRPGMDVEIHIDGKGIKDNIILRTLEALSFAGLILPDGYEYKQDKYKNTHVYYHGKDYITILAPSARDAKGKDVAVEAVLDGLKLRYEIEKPEEAVFPVTIDPCISYSDTANAMESAYICSNDPTTNFSSSYYLRSGSNNGTYISLLKPAILVGQKASDTIISAVLNMRTSAFGSIYEFFGAYPVNKAWTESTVTWNDLAASTDISNELTSYVPQTATNKNANKWNSFDITEIYKGWYQTTENSASSLNGIAIRWVIGGTYVEFYSTRSPYDKPYIVVNYVSHAGRKGWWKYETMGTGRAGTVYADIYNGNLIAEHADTATAGNRMPVSVSHIYNS